VQPDAHPAPIIGQVKGLQNVAVALAGIAAPLMTVGC